MAAIRDANESPFAAILQRLIDALPGAYASAFVDEEGECVEYAGAVDPFHVKVVSAHLRVVLETLNETRAAGRGQWFLVRGSRESVLVQRVQDLYALVVLYSRGAGFAHTPRALAVALREIAEEGSFSYAGERWYGAQLSFDERGRPSVWHRKVRIAPGSAAFAVCSEPLEIVGAVMGLARGELGYRLRLDSGAELTAIREVSGVWYTDDAYDDQLMQ